MNQRVDVNDESQWEPPGEIEVGDIIRFQHRGYLVYAVVRVAGQSTCRVRFAHQFTGNPVFAVDHRHITGVIKTRKE